MTTLDLLTQLRQHRITLRLDGSDLIVTAPEGVLTAELTAALRDSKPELVRWLAVHTDETLLAPLKPIPRGGPLPLSFAQERLWFLDRLDPGSPVYNIPVVLRFTGDLRHRALETSLNRIVERHETLRSRFTEEDGGPLVWIAPHQPVPLPLEDLRGQPDPAAAADARSLEEARRPFDLSRGPVIRATLLRLSESEHVLLLTVHHVVFDGGSIGILLEELRSHYDAAGIAEPVSGTRLPVQYADYAAWQREHLRGAALDTHLTWWKEQLKGLPDGLNLPLDRPRPAVMTYRGGWTSAVLPAPTVTRIRELRQGEGVTLFMALLAAFQVLLSRYSGHEEIPVGTPVSGRNQPETEPLIGLFVNTLVIQTDLTGNPTFRQILRRVRQITAGAHAHAELPFEKLVGELRPHRDMSRSPLFQVMFTLEDTNRNINFGNDGVEARFSFGDTGASRFDLSLFVEETAAGLEAGFRYNADLFDRSTGERMAAHFRQLLDSIAANPDVPVSLLTMSPEAERKQLIFDWNQTAVAGGKESVHERIRRQAARTPDAEAVSGPDGPLTYRLLDERSNRLARYLKSLGVGPDVRVGVCVDRSVGMVVALLGVLKSGGAYVPLDPHHPAERLAHAVQDAPVTIAVTESSQSHLIPGEAAVCCLDRDAERIGAESAEAFDSGVRADHLAYVIYTSGSTGKPKGVGVSHGNLANFLTAMESRLGLRADDRVAAITTIAFDIAALEIYLPLVCGAVVEIVPRETAMDGFLLRDRLEQNNVSVMQATPATWRMLLESGWTNPGRLRMLCGGEALSGDLAGRLRMHGDQLWNLYGPTETTVWSAARRVDSRDSSESTVRIGSPVANTQLYVLDRGMNPAPVGVAGELFIGGEGVARGYIGRPDLSAERFVPDPFQGRGQRLYRTGDLVRRRDNGDLEFLGRLDHQVKIRGFRIELEEVEAVLRKHPAVHEAAVAVHQDHAGEKRLVAYFTGETNRSELRAFLRQSLPDYMTPTAFVNLDSFPLTPNGKIDRRALPPPPPTMGAGWAPPTNLTESVLVETWEEVLGRQPIGIRDNFFDLGGHSLQAVRLLLRVERAIGRTLPLASIFQAPTIEGLARLLDETETP